MQGRSMLAGKLEDAIDKYRTIDRLKATERRFSYTEATPTKLTRRQSAVGLLYDSTLSHNPIVPIRVQIGNSI